MRLTFGDNGLGLTAWLPLILLAATGPAFAHPASGRAGQLTPLAQ